MRGYLNNNITTLQGFLCFVCALILCNFSFSQNQDKKWYFGSAAGLDFVTNPPTPITTSSMYGYKEGTASVADAFGNLLFYTDGVTIWDKNDQVMANGSGLFGSVISTQSALIVKQPGTSSIYFVFTLGATGGLSGLWYSIVDMSLSSGNGSVTAKNILINSPSSEKLTGTKHCNGIDIWIVTHDFYSDTFRSVLVTSAGVSPTPTLSDIGNIWSSRYESYGAAKISQNGKRLACPVYYTTSSVGNFELYDFDNSTGIISNQLSLNIPLSFPPQPLSSGQNPPPPPKLIPRPAVCFPYGCEFSPDGTKFYGSGALDSVLYQWDLCAGSNNAVINSRHAISSFTSSALQLAKDGKIYVARYNKQSLGVINNPNAAGAACNYVAQGQSIAPAFCGYGLPNFISETPHAPFTTNINGAVNCNIVTFSGPPPPTTTVTACATTGYNITGLRWYFGDPASGTANTSTLNNPVHTYPGQGTYTASLVYTYNNSCGGVNTDTLKQEVKIGVLPLVSSAGFNLCSGNSLLLSAPAAQNYSWSTGASTNSISVSPSATTIYTVTGIDINGCPYKSIQTIHVYTTPTVSIKTGTTICPGYQVKLVASGADTYSWSTGQIQPTVYPIQTTDKTYTLYGNTNGCVSQQTITVFVKLPDLLISSGTTVCPGTAVTLTVGGAIDYVWLGYSVTENSIVVTPTSTTLYTVQGMDAKACTTTASVLITVQTQTPNTEFYYKSPVCASANDLTTFTVSGFNGGGIYSSFDLQVDPGNGNVHVASAPSGTYVVTYTLAAIGCTAGAENSATLEIAPGPVLSITPASSISPGASITLEVSGATSYIWSPIDYLTCTDCSSPIATPPVNTEYCVTAQLNSCASTSCVSVAVTCETNADYSLPNAFTPNGDGTNDQFCLQGWSYCMKEFNIVIFNKWGELVFESSDPGFCWDGTYKGAALGSGVFVYVVKARRTNATESINRKGNISLIR